MRRSVDLTHDENLADANALRRMLDAIDSCPAPVIALVQVMRWAAARDSSRPPTSLSPTSALSSRFRR
jgi:hypothetical protein